MEQGLGVVICAVNSKYIHSALAPWYLLSGIRAYCDESIKAEVIDGTVNQSLELIAERIIAFAPQVVGFSCYIWNIQFIQQLIKTVKQQLPQTIIVLGGPEVSYNAEEVLNANPEVDYIISGEGELPFARLLNALLNKEDLFRIPGLIRRADGGIVKADPYISKSAPPEPYVPEYFKALRGRISYIETSRGCPFACAFCLSGRAGGVRFFDLERARRELVQLSNSGSRTVKFVDRTFNANPKRAYELFEFIIKNYGTAISKGVCVHFEIGADLLDEATIALLSAAPPRAIQLEIGVQSFNERTLQSISRKTDTGRVMRNIAALIMRGNIHIHIDLIAGLPFEDLNSFKAGFDKAYRLKPHILQLGFLKLLHGAPLRENAARYSLSYSKTPPYEIESTPWLAREDIKLIKHAAAAVDRLYNSGRFRRTLDYIMQSTGCSPFSLFADFGRYAFEYSKPGASLDEYTALVQKFFANVRGVDSMALRDNLVCDRLATTPSGRLPECLRIEDAKLKTVKNMLKQTEATRLPQGIKRAVAILYSEKCAVYADYVNKDPVIGEYKLNNFCFD